jgi:5-(carboxyamino)imidazole ribonucleotide mutase
MKFVSIILGSKSDYEAMKECSAVLDKFGVPYEFIISSAHRSPERTKNYVKDAEGRGSKVFIAAAGMAAHLAGALAAITTKPVIGVPCASSSSPANLDSLLSVVQMPPGVPVAGVGIGRGENAALLAARILGISNKKVDEMLESYRKELEQKTIDSN